MDGKPQVHCQIMISVSVDNVWDIVQDSALLPSWMPNVDYTHITSDQRQMVGEVRQCGVHLAGRSGQLVERCVEFAPQQRIAYRVQQDSFGFARMIAELGYELILESISTHKTLVRLEYHYQEKGVIGRVANALLIKPQWNPLCLEMLSGLKQFAENRYNADSGRAG
jgi:uncharacterized protein YndB with AHSA1/START domain